MNPQIEKAQEHFGKILEEQLARVERMKNAPDWINYRKLPCIIIGICPGDGIGEIISLAAIRVLKHILKREWKEGPPFLSLPGSNVLQLPESRLALPKYFIRAHGRRGAGNC